MRGQWESNINVWFPFMYSKKWNCAALLFSKQNYNVLSPNSYTLTHISVRDLRMQYIPRICPHILLQQNMWTDHGNIQYKSLTDTWMWKLGLRTRNSQKRNTQMENCAASLFPKQNYNVLSPNSYTHISVRDLYIPRLGPHTVFCWSQICGPIW